MSLRFHEIAESRHRILNPITDDKLDLLGEICRFAPGTRILDLACGKGELLSRWAASYGVQGVGVDISQVFLDAARTRADELGVAGQVKFVEADAAAYEDTAKSYDVVSCIGATWIGGGLEGTLSLMRRWLRPNGIVLVGECYWTSPPPAEACTSLGVEKDAFTSLIGTADRAEHAGFELLEMVLASPDSWDRYVAGQWWTISDWLRENPDDPDVPAMRDFLAQARRSHLEYGRDYLGWGVFVLRAM
ncbi:SAM-dependent methyltransferase [Nonomuraea gerenzanensis]|uniref:SAM-dependent methyltransferases n=1 Tax=Nonomuraea gerenzanensis TaxID=93944 RepID=A0A1M4EHM8_9ACTN|nr:methyltransferase domain-containing protein [Nonomuraea gerenzanensis]UBU09815.1 methyltransferase domain-containing protein [Nonomuraea gerenzanensis]SBO98264.1 SAM-dependent methyltransferases [Nonomuraea gerenzanensis]